MISLSMRDQTVSVLVKLDGIQHRVALVWLLPAKPAGQPEWVLA